MKESVKGATQDGVREGVNMEGGRTEQREELERKGDGHRVGNKLLKEEEEDREDIQKASRSLAECSDV